MWYTSYRAKKGICWRFCSEDCENCWTLRKWEIVRLEAAEVWVFFFKKADEHKLDKWRIINSNWKRQREGGKFARGKSGTGKWSSLGMYWDLFQIIPVGRTLEKKSQDNHDCPTLRTLSAREHLFIKMLLWKGLVRYGCNDKTWALGNNGDDDEFTMWLEVTGVTICLTTLNSFCH